MMIIQPKLEVAVTGQSGASVVGLSLPLEQPHDSLCFPCKALKGRNNVEILKRHSLAESYLKSDLSVILDLAVQGYSSSVGIGRDQHDFVSVNRPAFVLHFHALDTRDREHWNQEFVFILNVECVKGEKIAVPSLVTFHSIEHESDDGRGGWYFSAFRERVFKFLTIPPRVDGEMSMLRRGLRTERVNGSDPDDIKCASEIVDCIANHQGDIGTQFPVRQSVIEELFPRLGIDVHSGAVSVRRGVESRLDICDVLIGPLDL